MVRHSTSYEVVVVPRQSRTRPVTAAQVRSYAGKAEEFLAAATAELEAGRAIAATSLSIHTGINAADAITGLRVGRRAAAPATTRCSTSCATPAWTV